MKLTDTEQRWLRGDAGRAKQFAVEMMVAAARTKQTTEFVDIEFAHINSCHYSGQLSLDFAEFLLAEGAEFAVPTHTNASLIACETPTLRAADSYPDEVAGARRLMSIYEALGCSTMWTCAPYQQPEGRPTFGQHVAGSESNAVSFYNSVLGARTNKYGDLLDVCAAIVGRVPLTGLHTDDGRLGTHLFHLDLSQDDLANMSLPHLLGIFVGEQAGTRIPIIEGIEHLDEDGLKALAAAAATAGSVAMFHVVGITPEAASREDATGGNAPRETTVIDGRALADVRARLGGSSGTSLDAVCLGTPHFSVDEFGHLVELLSGRQVHEGVSLLVTTSRASANELMLRGWDKRLELAGVEVVVDTCTYYPPRARGVEGTVMTNSAKWAYYAPGMLDVDVIFGDIEACVEAAVAGRTSP